jgi:hypothetical protein
VIYSIYSIYVYIVLCSSASGSKAGIFVWQKEKSYDGRAVLTVGVSHTVFITLAARNRFVIKSFAVLNM